MSVTALCRALQAHWQAFTQHIWPESREQRTRAEIDRLTVELLRQHQRLVRWRCRIEQQRDRLARLERRTALLLERVQTCDLASSWELALTLDRLHHAARRHRARLEQYEQTYRHLRQLFDERKQRRLALQRGEEVLRDLPELDW